MSVNFIFIRTVSVFLLLFFIFIFSSPVLAADSLWAGSSDVVYEINTSGVTIDTRSVGLYTSAMNLDFLDNKIFFSGFNINPPTYEGYNVTAYINEMGSVINLPTGTEYSRTIKSFSGSVWVGKEDGFLMSCDSSGLCTDFGDKGERIYSMEVFSGKLWIGQNGGSLKSCDSSGICIDHGSKGLGYIRAMTIFDNKLWLALELGGGDTNILSCDSAGFCVNHGTKTPSSDQVNALKEFNGYLIIATGRGDIYRCDILALCSLFRAGETWSTNPFVLYDAVNAMEVFNNNLWAGTSRGKLLRYDTSFTETSFGYITALNSSINVFGVYDLSSSPSFTCLGTDPANATMCSGDDTGLTADTPKTLVSSCTDPTKCEFTCSTGYFLSGGVCVVDNPPSINIENPSTDPYPTLNSTVNISGTATDDIGVNQVTWSNDRGGSGNASYSNPNWSANNISLQSGLNIITVTASDTSGNTASDSITVNYSPDSNPPNIEITSPTINSFYTTNLAQINISGTASDDEGLIQQTALRNLTTGDLWYVGMGATWSRADVPLVYGQNIIEATATDLAGNTSTDTLTINRLPPDGELLGYAWTDTIGWISMTSKNHTTGPIYYRVVVDPDTGYLSGYGWSENVGWVSFEYNAPFAPPSISFNERCYNYNNIDTTNNCTTSNGGCTACYDPRTELGAFVGEGIRGLNGWARVYSLGNNGWIKLSNETGDPGSNYGARYNLFNNEFFGYAWNGNSAPNEHTGIGWLSFNCLDSGNNCAVSNYKVMADLNKPPVATIDLSDAENQLPCGAAAACISDCELEPVVRWGYYDPEGFGQYAYRVVLRNDGLNAEAPGHLGDTGKVYDSIKVIDLNSIYPDQFTYDTNYSVHIMVWDNFDLQAEEWESFNFTTHNNKFPIPYFNWFVPNASAEEEVLFWDTSLYFPNSSGTRNNSTSTPASCQVSTCTYLWWSTSDVGFNDETLATTTATYKFDGNNQDMFLAVTDGNGYTCSTSTTLNINKRLPSWIETR